MTTAQPAGSTVTTAPAPDHRRLKAGALGMSGVVFTVLATAAPITAMTGNVPIAIGSGSGVGTPAAFVLATTVLVVFTIGYSAMARHITATGAFYGFVTRGASAGSPDSPAASSPPSHTSSSRDH